jgi:demethylmenaquinone methyltransferase/2-methoxy-6-polyprenyl-1,4-benzoquinol methylase
MANYSHDAVVPFKDSQLGKKQQVARMFDQIAFRYDFLNHFLSGGVDLYWRRRAIRELRRSDAMTSPPVRSAVAADADATAILDVATGTADMPILMARNLPGALITGVDISTGMLDIARAKIAKSHLAHRITLLTGDSEALQFPDGQFDAVTVAFGVRNFEHLEDGLKEMLRVLKPGGKLIILEFSQPRIRGVRQLYELYTRLVACRIGRMVSSNPDAYRYLNDSVRAFPEGKTFLGILDACGYKETRQDRLSLGVCSLYTGTRPI